jgi:hypothetical protein
LAGNHVGIGDPGLGKSQCHLLLRISNFSFLREEARQSEAYVQTVRIR